MKKLLSIVAMFVFLCANVANAYPLSDKVKGELRKTVKVFANTLDGKRAVIGSGFAIDEVRLITAGHLCKDVVEGANAGIYDGKVVVEWINEKDQTVRVLDVEIIKFELTDDNDACVLFKLNHNIPPVVILDDYNKVSYGDRVYIVGAPGGIYPIITEGFVSMPISHHMPINVLNNKLLTSAPAYSGNSGGPVFNRFGKVIGILVMANPKYPMATFSITSDTLLKYLSEPF
jgi:S1-C subfamily serine protease